MKTREVTCVGYLHILNGAQTDEFLLVREEQFTEPPTDGRKGWTVVSPYSSRYMSADDNDLVYATPKFLLTNAPWYVDFKEQTILVEDTSEDDFEPTPSPDDPDWESIFKEEDKQNTIEIPDPE